MNKSTIIFLLFALLLPLVGRAQDTVVVDIDEFVEEFNSMCPIDYKDGFAARSFTPVDTNYVLVDLQVPASISMFLSALTSDNDNVRKMWISQLKLYGERWHTFIDLLVANNRPLIINLRPQGSEDTVLFRLNPSDFKNHKNSSKKKKK